MLVQLLTACAAPTSPTNPAVAPTVQTPSPSPTLQGLDDPAKKDGLCAPFVNAWQQAANDPAFQAAQDAERDQLYFDPAVAQAKADGLRTLGQFISTTRW